MQQLKVSAHLKNSEIDEHENHPAVKVFKDGESSLSFVSDYEDQNEHPMNLDMHLRGL